MMRERRGDIPRKKKLLFDTLALDFLFIGLLLILVFASLGVWQRGLPSASTPIVYHETTIVIVNPGDSLWSISQELFPEHDPGAIVHEIRQLNPKIDPGALQIGQTLTIPRW